MSRREVPVLIVGGGPVGLSTGLFLGRHGVSSMLVEKRDGTSLLPRAPGLQARTMELFRAAGIGRQIRDLEMGDSHPYFEGGILRVNTFAEIDDAVVLEAPSLDGPDISPERVMGCGQDRYERVLAELARAGGTDVRMSTRLESLEQDADGVTARITDLESGEQTTVHAQYVVAADGASSTIRNILGIERHGRGSVFHALSIYFSSPGLEALLKDRKFILCYATAAPGTMMGLSRLHGRDPWLAAPLYFPEQGERPEDFTDERCIEIIRTSAGDPDLGVQIMAKVPWEGSQLIAETFRSGRVFLAGDAAHVHPPAGGFGANTGIHDAHNLAWKLALVLQGKAADSLLDSYDAERRRTGDAMAQQAMIRNRIRHGHADDETRAAMVDDIIITLGYRYFSDNVLTEDADAPVLTPHLQLTGQPGTRAPHVDLRREGELISTIDLFWDEFVLLTGDPAGEWAEAAHRVAKQFATPLRVHVIGAGEQLQPAGRDWAAAYGVDPDGAVLVRPDAMVAWRSKTSVADPESRLAEVMATVGAVAS